MDKSILRTLDNAPQEPEIQVSPDNIWCTQDEQERCVAHTGTSGLSVALVGDSQARMIAPLLLDLARAHDFTMSYSIVSACPWQRGVVNTLLDDQEQRECDASREDLRGIQQSMYARSCRGEDRGWRWKRNAGAEADA